tara:strand:- start:66 stop:383 length:318 start_codon:yes stop_codon:yes gene_type:complete
MTDIKFNKNLTYRGEFQATTSGGSGFSYSDGDLVLFEGKLFLANGPITGHSPDTSSSWVPWGNSRISFRATSPPDAKIGDTWININTGKFYTFMSDGDTSQWVEL